MKIDRIWSMPNKHTFDIKPIKELLLQEMTNGIWIDPFANKNKLATITNDLSTEFDTDYHMDALEFLKMFADNSVDGVLYDPPYSPRQVSECYNNVGYNVTWDTTKASFWGNHKREISRIIKKDGKVITFGWNSGGIGKTNGFEISRILLVPHGGWHNDTICTVEIKTRVQCEKQINDIKEKESKEKSIKQGGIMKHEYSITDNLIIEKLKALPIGYWDFKNEDTKELTHGIHTYPAIMVYPISRKIISMMREVQTIESMLDPFMGSGTVILEGALAGFNNVYGTDLNPLARLISTVKTKQLHHNAVSKAINTLQQVIEREYIIYDAIINQINAFIMDEKQLDITAKNGWGSDAPKYVEEFLLSNNVSFEVPCFKNIGYWFKPNVIIELQVIKNAIKTIEDIDIRNFAWIAFSESIRLVSNRRNGEFKMFRMPQAKISLHNPNVKAEFFKLLDRNVNKMKSYYDYCDTCGIKTEISIYSNDARELGNIPDNSIDLMVTSPPYGDSRTTVAYGEFSRLSLQWIDLYNLTNENIMGIDKSLMGGQKYRNGFELTLKSQTLRTSLDKIKDVDIERAGDVYSFYKDLDDCMNAITKKMKINSYQFWVVGNRTVKLETLQTDKIISELGEKYNLMLVSTIDRNISNKVMPSQNSPSNVIGEKVTTMTNEHIVILRKYK